MPPISRAPRRYFIEFNSAMVLYVAAIFAGVYAKQHVADPMLRTALIVSPILPICLAAFAVVRFYRGMDEFHRRRLLEAISISALVTAVFSVSWEFLEAVGLPHLPLFAAWIVMGLTWAVVALYFGWNDKISTRGTALRSVFMTLIYVAIGTAVAAFVLIATGIHPLWPWLALATSVLFIARMGFVIYSKTGSC